MGIRCEVVVGWRRWVRRTNKTSSRVGIDLFEVDHQQPCQSCRQSIFADEAFGCWYASSVGSLTQASCKKTLVLAWSLGSLFVGARAWHVVQITPCKDWHSMLELAVLIGHRSATDCAFFVGKRLDSAERLKMRGKGSGERLF